MGLLPGWKYRKEVTLSRASGAVTNYQMQLFVGESSGAAGVSVDCGGLCKTDFSDIRFTKSDGTTILDYWIEDFTGTTPNQRAVIWIEFDSIGTGDTVFYMYYGNAGAAAYSNGANTFITFDDFERGADGDTIGGSWTEVSAHVHISTEKTGSHIASETRSAKFVGATGTVSTATIPLTPSDNIALRLTTYREAAVSSVLLFAHGNGSKGIYMGNVISPGDLYYYDGSWKDTGVNMASDGWGVIEVKNINWTAGTYDIYYNDALAKAGAGMRPSWNGYNGVCGISEEDTVTGRDVWIDNFTVRNFRDIGPVWGGWGVQQSLPGITMPIAIGGIWKMSSARGILIGSAWKEIKAAKIMVGGVWRKTDILSLGYVSVYPPAQNDTYVKATTHYSANYQPYFATDPLLYLSGTWANNAWIAGADLLTNQRFHIDLGEAIPISRIYYENGHSSGGYSDTGAKNFTFWGSNNAGSFAELTYGTDTGWTQLATSPTALVQHLASDNPEPRYVIVNNTTAYRYYAFKFADNYGHVSYMVVRRIELQKIFRS